MPVLTDPSWKAGAQPLFILGWSKCSFGFSTCWYRNTQTYCLVNPIYSSQLPHEQALRGHFYSFLYLSDYSHFYLTNTYFTAHLKPSIWNMEMQFFLNFLEGKMKANIISFIVDLWTKQASQLVLMVKNPPANAGDIWKVGSIPGSRRSPRGRNGNPFQSSCLENLMHREGRQAI